MTRAGAGRGTAVRELAAKVEVEGFVPAMAWRDVEARIAALEHAFTVKLAAGLPVIKGSVRTWTRLPAWAR